MLKIAVIGPESSGKSTLCKYLSKYFEGVYFQEFARPYLEEKQGKYLYEDLEIIARKQNEERKNITKPINFFDTENISLKIWSDYRYGKTSEYILQLIQEQNFDFYLLCEPDLPWEYDLLRENPNDRYELFEIFKKELIQNKFPYGIINGNDQIRMENAVRIIKTKI